MQLLDPSRFGKEGFDGVHQRRFLYRLDDVPFRSLALAPDFVGFLILGCDDDHGDMTGGRVFSDLPGGLKPVNLGHDHVHKDKIRQFRLSHLNAFGAIFCRYHVVAIFF